MGTDHKIKFKRNENFNHEAKIYTIKDGKVVPHQIKEKKVRKIIYYGIDYFIFKIIK